MKQARGRSARREYLKRLALLGVLGGAFAAGFGARSVLAESQQVTVEPESFVSPASYTIFKSGSLVKARNGRTGQIEFSDPDAATVIQQAIDSISRGTIVLKSELTLTSAMQLKSNVKVLIEGKIDIASDIYGFILDGTENARLEGGEIEVTASTYTKAPIKLSGDECRRNKIKNVRIKLPSGQGYGLHLRYASEEEGYWNTFESIDIFRGKQGIQVELIDNGWFNGNYFADIKVWRPSEYGFAIINNGNGYGGNVHIGVITEVGAQDNVSAFFLEGTGSYFEYNTFAGCDAYDLGSTNSYFFAQGSSLPSYRRWNTIVGGLNSHVLQGSWQETFTLIAPMNFRTDIYENYYELVLQNKPNITIKLLPSGESNNTRIEINRQPILSREALLIGALEAGAFNIKSYAYSGYTLRPLRFQNSHPDGTLKTVATMDTDDNFKFNAIAIPTSVPTNPVTGSMYFDPETNKLYIYNGTAWVSVALT